MPCARKYLGLSKQEKICMVRSDVTKYLMLEGILNFIQTLVSKIETSYYILESI